MNHKGTIRLETNRLVLRKFEYNDAQDMYDNWASDEEVTKYLRWPAHKNVDVSREYVKMVVDGYTDKKYDWIIELKETKKAIGTIGVVMLDEKVSNMHIGYCIGRKYWHQGITSEAFLRVIDFLFNEVEVNRIESLHDPNNPNSGKVMEKCGLKFEGLHRKADFNNQGICDAKWYSILRDEYLLENNKR